MVPGAGFEPACLATEDFKSPAATFSPSGLKEQKVRVFCNIALYYNGQICQCFVLTNLTNALSSNNTNIRNSVFSCLRLGFLLKDLMYFYIIFAR